MPEISRWRAHARDVVQRYRWYIVGIGLGLAALFVVAIGALPERSTDKPPEASPYVAFARGRVDVEPGMIQLAARRDGIVKAVYVDEGQRVEAGQALARLDDTHAHLQLDRMEKEMAQARAALDVLGTRRRAAERERARLLTLVQEQAAARVDLEQAQDTVAVIDGEMSAAQAALQAAQARYRLAEHEIEQHVVRAPIAGYIVRRQVRPGDGVSMLNVTPLFWFAADLPRIVRAEVEEDFIDSVAVGMAAEIVVQGKNERIIPGRVQRLGMQFGPKRPITDDPHERADARVVEVIVAPDATPPLLLGQRVLVRFKRPE
jgi:RND family efflux transporter MFP subunit